MPAPKLRPVVPRMITVPPVMYSQPWSPTPSTTVVAPLFLTAKRSPARAVEERAAVRRAVQHDVAHDDLVVRPERAPRAAARTATTPPERPLPT